MERSLRLALAVGVVSVLSACPQKGPCAGMTCDATQRCDMGALRCVADLAPAITLDVPAVVSDATFVATGSVTDDVAVKSAEWRAGTSEWTAIPLAADGTFSLTIPAPLVDAKEVVVSIRARDALQEASLDRSTRVDRLGPTAELLSPDAGSLHNTATIEATLVVSDGSGSLSELTVNGMAVPNPMSGATVTATLDVPMNADGAPLTLPVSARDSRGNSSVTMFSFVGDRVAPQVSITAPMANALVASATLTMTFTATDPSGIRSATCSNTAGATAQATQTGANLWSCDLPVEAAERGETLTVVVVDAAGNATTQLQPIQIDRIAPVVTIVSPNSGSIFRIAFGVTASTTGNATAVTARLMSTGANVSLVGGPSWNGTVEVPAHDYAAEVLVVEATDLAGNVGSATANIFTDTVVPVVTFTTPLANQQFNIATLGANTTVRSAWMVADADPAAATTRVDNVASTVTSIDKPTSATDNPQTYTTTVVASDRAGNDATVSITYTVDRVAPTVVTWTPAANARLVFPRTSVVTYSEPVTTSVAGLTVVGQTQPAGAWTGNTFTLNLDPFALRAVDLSLGAVTDLLGNPVAPATRHIYLGTGFARGTNLTIGSGPVLDYDVSSDSDGVLTVALMTRGTAAAGDEVLEVYRDTGSTFTRVTPPSGFPANVASVQTSSWNVVNADLSSSPRFSVVATQFLVGDNHRFWSVDGVAARDSSTSPVAIISRPRLGPSGTIPVTTPREPADNAIGGIVGSTYTRLNGSTPYSVTLPQLTGAGVAQSNSNWTSFATTGSAVLWSRFYCWYGQFVGRLCSSYATSVAATAPTELQTAVTRGGGCMLVSWTEGANRRGVAETRPGCEGATEGCGNDGTTTAVSSTLLSGNTRAGTWDANGEDTLLVARALNGGAQVDKMVGCGFNGSPAATFSLAGLLANATPTKLRPVRAGDRVGVLYLDSNSVLRLAIEP